MVIYSRGNILCKQKNIAMKLKTLCNEIEAFAPINLQESYDNSGLIVGNIERTISKAIISLDVTEDIVDEAIQEKADLIIAHHPLIFKPLKRITGSTTVERIVQKAIKNDIAIYAVHTNLDNIFEGVNLLFSHKLGLINPEILLPKPNTLKKLIVYVPTNFADTLKQSLFSIGAGTIGNYDSCSFQLEGKGSFKPLDGSNPFVGDKFKIHYEEESKIEMVFPAFLQSEIIRTLRANHPYEEPAFDVYALENEWEKAGSGMLAYLPEALDEIEFLKFMKTRLQLNCIRHSPLIGKKVKKIALCGGSGSFLIPHALKAKADVFISADIKYHDFFESENQLLIADIGHYESEQFTKQFLVDFINKKFPNFAVQISGRNTNVVNYL